MIFSGVVNFEVLYYSVIIALSISILFGSLFYFYDIYFGPKKRISELNKYPFTEFLKIGFERKENYLIGKINGFVTIISYDWRGKNGFPSVYGIIIFEPKIKGKFLNNYDLNKFQKSIKDKFNFWEFGQLRTEWSYIKGKPNHKLIIEKLKKNSNLISKKGIREISLANWEKEIKRENLAKLMLTKPKLD